MNLEIITTMLSKELDANHHPRGRLVHIRRGAGHGPGAAVGPGDKGLPASGPPVAGEGRNSAGNFDDSV